MASHDSQKQSLLEDIELSDDDVSGLMDQGDTSEEEVIDESQNTHTDAVINSIETLEELINNSAKKSAIKKYLLELRDILNMADINDDVHSEYIQELEDNITSITINDFDEGICQSRREKIEVLIHRINKYYQRIGNIE